MEQEQIERVFAHLKEVLGIPQDDELDEVMRRVPEKRDIEDEDEVDAEGARRFYAAH
jgi:hypothetical protein